MSPSIDVIRRCCVVALLNLLFATTSVFAQTGVVNLVGSLEFPGFDVTDVVSYVDPLTDTEYAIVGFSGSASGIHIVDLSDPSSPQLVKTLEGPPGFDVKVYQNYVYTVNGGNVGSGSIIDIADPPNAVQVSTFPSSHNIFIDKRGYIFAEVSGLIIYDLRADPTVPVEIWNDDANGGHDATVIGNRLYDFHGSETTIYDITDVANPTELGFIDPPFIAYHHSGWTTADSSYLFINDELSQNPSADVTIWDISDPENPEFVTDISDETATVHNLHIVDNLAFFSYYSAGLKVFDISDPTDPQLVGSYDTDPTSGENFSGAFGIDAFLPSRHVLVSGASGVMGSLHVFSVDGFTPVGVDETENNLSVPQLHVEIYPNPVTTQANIAFDGTGSGRISIIDVLGRQVYSKEFSTGSGRRVLTFNSSDLAAGTYLVTVTVDDRSATKSLSVVD